MDIINQYFYKDDNTLNFLGKFSKIILFIIIIQFSIVIINYLIDKVLLNKSNKTKNIRKVNTIKVLLKSVTRYTLYFILIIAILDIVGFNTSGLITAAGIGGIAIGFGAQSLVKDIITGLFILLEDQFSVGDYIEVGEFSGIVQSLGVRITTIKDFSGDFHIIPNGNIITVTNKNKNIMRALITVKIGYDEDIDKVIKILDGVTNKIKNEHRFFIEGPEVLGITDLGEHYVELRLAGKTIPMKQWEAERIMRKETMDALKKNNIKLAHPIINIKEND